MTTTTPPAVPAPPRSSGGAPRQDQRVSGRVPDEEDLLVVTPWYPGPHSPYAGGFVRESVRALSRYYGRTTIVHVENRPEDDDRPPAWRDSAEGRVLWIGVPMDPLTPRAEMMLRQREALRTHALDLVRAAPVVHCHVGAPTGAALVDLLDPATRLVLTEHATYLPQVLRNPDARRLYLRVVDRAHVVTAVGGRTAAVIERNLPRRAERLMVVPNPVPLESLRPRTEPPASLSRWLFVGNLVPHKGVGRLLRAFAEWVRRSGDPDPRLTVVGQGAQRAELVELAARLGVADRVRFVGPVEPDRMGQVYRDHDVLVHLSHTETFGLTCVEAAACGLPVLATASGGPEQSLAVHAALGLAQIVPVAPDTATEEVIAAMHRLRAGVAAATAADLRAGRDHLERCYGAPRIAARLHAALAGGPGGERSPAPPGAGGAHDGPLRGVRVLGIAVLPEHTRAVEGSLRQVAAFGGSGLYLTTQPVRSVLPEEIRLVDISAVERSWLPSRLERALVLRGPGLALRALGRAARLADVLTGAAGRGLPAGTLVRRVEALQERHRALARRVRWGPYAALWRLIGPWYVAHRLESAGILHGLGLDDVDGLVVTDAHMTPAAVRVLRIRPELAVHRRWDAEAIARAYAARVRGATAAGQAR